MGVEKNLSDALGIEHLPVPKEETKQEVVEYVPAENEDGDEDYRLVRNTLRNLIEKGNDALEDISTIARQNEIGRAHV